MYIDFNEFVDSIWLMIITVTTVGYGDGFPRSPIGRFFDVIGFVMG